MEVMGVHGDRPRISSRVEKPLARQPGTSPKYFQRLLKTCSASFSACFARDLTRQRSSPQDLDSRGKVSNI